MMRVCELPLLLLGTCVALSSCYKSYTGYTLLELLSESEENARILPSWQRDHPDLDFWSYQNGRAVVLVPPSYKEFVISEAALYGMDFKIIKEDVQKDLDLEYERLSSKPKYYDPINFNTLSDIYAEMGNLVRNHCPAGFNCEIYNMGDSYEIRPIYVVRISKPGENRKGIWVDSAINPRDWLSAASNMRVLDYMMKNYDRVADVQRSLDNFDWYFVPLMNPDGYIYTWVSDRYWNKNRRQISLIFCYGVDLNRNFDFRWGVEGGSSSACSDDYIGDFAASEVETRVHQAELKRLGPSLAALVSLHAPGSAVLYPWSNTEDFEGYDCEDTDDKNETSVVAKVMAKAMGDRFGTSWLDGSNCELRRDGWGYGNTGGIEDYAKGVAGVKYAFYIALRGEYPEIDAIEITPSFRELFAGLVAMADQIQ